MTPAAGRPSRPAVRTLLGGLVLLATVAVTACGGGDGSSESTVLVRPIEQAPLATETPTTPAATETPTSSAGSAEHVCALFWAMETARSAFMDDALDGVPGEMPGPAGMRSALETMRETADELLRSGVNGDAAVTAEGIVAAAELFDQFLSGYGYDLREFDYSGDTPIDDDLNDIIFMVDFDALEAARAQCQEQDGPTVAAPRHDACSPSFISEGLGDRRRGGRRPLHQRVGLPDDWRAGRQPAHRTRSRWGLDSVHRLTDDVVSRGSSRRRSASGDRRSRALAMCVRRPSSSQ